MVISPVPRADVRDSEFLQALSTAGISCLHLLPAVAAMTKFCAVYVSKQLLRRVSRPQLTSCFSILCASQNLICNTIRLERPDVLHCTLDCISAFFILAAKFYHVPVVGSVHTDVQVCPSQDGKFVCSSVYGLGEG